jgi:hypothetical protein
MDSFATDPVFQSIAYFGFLAKDRWSARAMTHTVLIQIDNVVLIPKRRECLVHSCTEIYNLPNCHHARLPHAYSSGMNGLSASRLPRCHGLLNTLCCPYCLWSVDRLVGTFFSLRYDHVSKLILTNSSNCVCI